MMCLSFCVETFHNTFMERRLFPNYLNWKKTIYKQLRLRCFKTIGSCLRSWRLFFFNISARFLQTTTLKILSSSILYYFYLTFWSMENREWNHLVALWKILTAGLLVRARRTDQKRTKCRQPSDIIGCTARRICPLNVNIWKSYIWTADKDVNESDPRSDKHYLNPWPLRYRCIAQPTELTSQLGAIHHFTGLFGTNIMTSSRLPC